MKKPLYCVALMSTALLGTTAFAQTEYNPSGKYVQDTNQTHYQTVLIAEGKYDGEIEPGKIVYVDQATSTFDAATKFMLKRNSQDKQSVNDGVYTIILGSEEQDAIRNTFYVGMTDSTNDVVLTRIPGNDGETTNANGTKNIGYKNDSITGTFTAVVIKTGDVYYGVKLNADTITVDNASVGIQINGITDDQAANTTVWLTSRSFELQTTEQGGTQQ